MYSDGDGSTTFNLPDSRGRAVIGEGTGAGLTARTLAGTVGAETHTLITAEMPSHTHPNGASHQVNQLNGGGYPSGSHNPVTGTTGGNAAMNVMNPFVVTKMIISY
jgi:microcystin-dependent protein